VQLSPKVAATAATKRDGASAASSTLDASDLAGKQKMRAGDGARLDNSPRI